MTEPSDQPTFDDLADRFAEAVRAGERPDVEAWAREHAEHAEAIRNLFPTILAMEQMKSSSTAVRPRVSLTIGDRLGDFEIIREIGRGGMGVVFEAQQDSLDRRVALKVLPGGEDTRRLQRFEREVRTAAKLHHTNIVPIFGVGEHDGWRYYVMPVIHGVSLDRIAARMNLDRRALEGEDDWMPSGGADSVSEVVGSLYRVVETATGNQPANASAESEARRSSDADSMSRATSRGPKQLFRSIAEVGRQTASALAYAHASGVLHRDIKPANLLLDRDGIVWITDFGLAIASGSDELTRTGDVLGTVQYLAPEQLDGRADARSDVFALGLTLYELCCGRPARHGDDRAQILRDAATVRPERLQNLVPAIPKDLETIVHRACELDPKHRYQSAKELEDDLERFLEGRPIAARRTSPGEELWRWCQRNRLVASLATAAVIGVVGGGSAAVVGWYRASQSSEISAQRLRDAYAGFDNVAAALVGIGRLGVADADPESTDGQAAWFETSVEWKLSDVSERERAVAEDLLSFYESLAGEVEGSDDRELLARASRRRGDLLGFLREFEPARAAYRSALDVYAEFATEEARLARAEIHFRLANLELAAAIEAVVARLDDRSRERLTRRGPSLQWLAAQDIDAEALARARSAIEDMQRELTPIDAPEAAYQFARSEKAAATVALLDGDPPAADHHWRQAAERFDSLIGARPDDAQLASEAVETALLLVGGSERRRDWVSDASNATLDLAYRILEHAAPHIANRSAVEGLGRRLFDDCLRLAGMLHYARRQRDDLGFDAPLEVVVDRVIELEGEELAEARRALLFAASIGALSDREEGQDLGERTKQRLDEMIPLPPDDDFSPLAAARRELRRQLEDELAEIRAEIRERLRNGAGSPRSDGRRRLPPR